jgi:hypothetical protein
MSFTALCAATRDTIHGGTQEEYRRELGGAQARNRTTDTRIFSPLLYHLSYLGTQVRAL